MLSQINIAMESKLIAIVWFYAQLITLILKFIEVKETDIDVVYTL